MALNKSIISSARALGAFIHDVRIERNLTQESLATLAGVSRSWLIGIEQGKRQRAELDKILSVLETLDINLVLERQSAERPSVPGPNTPQSPGVAQAPSDGINEQVTKMLKSYIPHFGQASGITQALNRQNQNNKADNSSE